MLLSLMIGVNSNMDKEIKIEYSTKIYLHKRLDTGEVFYVGIGGGKRPWETGNRNKFWRNIVKKAGYEVVVIEDCLTWDQAYEIEIMLVAHYGRRDRGKGPLVNLTDGGQGSPGHKHTDESKAKISAANKGKTAPNKGIPMSQEQRAKISAAGKGKTLSPETRAKLSASGKGNTNVSGYIHSPEARAKMSAANKGKTTSPETSAKISAAGKGRTHSPETRAKLSAANKAYWEAKRKGQ